MSGNTNSPDKTFVVNKIISSSNQTCQKSIGNVLKLVSMVRDQNKSEQFVVEPVLSKHPTLYNGLTTVFGIEGVTAKLNDIKNTTTSENQNKKIYRIMPNTHAQIVNYIVIDKNSDLMTRLNNNDVEAMRKFLDIQRSSAERALQQLMNADGVLARTKSRENLIHNNSVPDIIKTPTPKSTTLNSSLPITKLTKTDTEKVIPKEIIQPSTSIKFISKEIIQPSTSNVIITSPKTPSMNISSSSSKGSPTTPKAINTKECSIVVKTTNGGIKYIPVSKSPSNSPLNKLKVKAIKSVRRKSVYLPVQRIKTKTAESKEIEKMHKELMALRETVTKLVESSKAANSNQSDNTSPSSSSNKLQQLE